MCNLSHFPYKHYLFAKFDFKTKFNFMNDSPGKKYKTDFLIDGLSEKEIRNFEKYLRSRTGRQDFLLFWESIAEVYKKKKNSAGFKEEAGASGLIKKYDRKFLSDFNKILESFYVCNAVENDRQGYMIYLLREMRMRNLDKLFSDLLNDVKKYHKHKVLKGFVHNITLLRSYYEEYFISYAMNEEENLFKLSNQINDVSQNVLIQKIFFQNIIKKLYSSILVKPETELLVDYDTAKIFVESRIKYFRTKHENIYMLYLISSMIDRSGDEEDVLRVINYLKSCMAKFTVDFAYHAYEYILRYLINRINQGKQESLVLAYKMIDEVDRKGLLKIVPHVQPLDFFAVINIYVRMRKLEQAEAFIDNYSGKLLVSSRKDILNISRAIIEFAKGNFSVSKQLVSNIKVKSLSLYIFAKATLVKSLYEKNELIAISSISDTVKHFLIRKKELTPFYRESIFRFFSYVNRLAYSRRNKGKGIRRIGEDLKEEITFYQKKWIEEKFAELLSAYPEK